MITITYDGRLGNNLIQYAAGYILAKKTGTKLGTEACQTYSNQHRFKTPQSKDLKITIDFGSVFNIDTIEGNIYKNSIELNDENYFEHLNSPLEKTGYKINGFFHDPRLLCDYRSDILKLYNPKINTLKIDPDDAFFACRFGDYRVSGRTYCTMKYIQSQFEDHRNDYNNVYLTSDSINHPHLVELIKKYNITPYNNLPLETILFAKNFNHLFLSAGSFSYWMAYLSTAKNITVFKSLGPKHKQDHLQNKNTWSYNANVKFYT